jgi:hypothetical protein
MACVYPCRKMEGGSQYFGPYFISQTNWCGGGAGGTGFEQRIFEIGDPTSRISQSIQFTEPSVRNAMMELTEYRHLSSEVEPDDLSQREFQNDNTETPHASADNTHRQASGLAQEHVPNHSFQHESTLKLLPGAQETEDVEADDDDQREKRSVRSNFSKWTTNRPAWFTTVFVGFILALLAMIINAGILGWMYSSFALTENGTAVLFSGPCSKTAMITNVSHLLINILSTLLLAVSNNCAQLLSSPTRAEVDKAHKSGRWLHIGGFSYRNIPWISPWRTLGCCFLILSSFPLHLL